MKKTFWLSYDCDGSDSSNYGDLYKWLREHKATECGNSVAYVPGFCYEDDFCEAIEAELKKIPHLTRAYVIYRDEEPKTSGIFVIGKRKDNPWDK